MGVFYRFFLITVVSLCYVKAQTVHYSENFEGTPSMTVSGGGWQFGTPSSAYSSGPQSVPEGTKCAGTNLTGPYADNAEYILSTTSTITIPNSAVVRLSFYEWTSLEQCCDSTYVEVQQNGSSTWTLLSETRGAASWNLRIIDLSTYKNSSIRIRFRFTSDPSVTYAGWYIDQVQVYSPVTRSLTVTNNGNGTTTPTGIVSIETSTPYTISAVPNSGYRFLNWTVLSGTATIANPNVQNTAVQITNDASIKANFTTGTVYPITSTPTLYNFNTNYYEISPDNGVRFRFVAPVVGTYYVAVDSSYKYLYDYGTSSTFSTVLGSRNSSSRIIYMFTSTTPNETHYFKVLPYTSSYNQSNFLISVTKSATLIVTTDGKGITYPHDTLHVFSGIDTLVTAIPNGGYKFSRWSLLSGTGTISRLDSAVTRIAVTSDTVRVRANFLIDPNIRPNVEISDLNISSHPDICVTASVKDSAGRSITGLDSSNFVLTQDADTVDYQLTTVSSVAGVSVALVIDMSGSMCGTALDASIEAALQFVRTMGPRDRCAIVAFDDLVEIKQTITGDTSLLIAAINQIVCDGGTAILQAASAGIDQLLQETNTRAVIIYSDGQDGSSTPTMASVISQARTNHTTVYSIGIGSSASTVTLKPLADSTGGYFTAAPSASDLAQIYAQIKSDVEAQYILCYQSPDVIFNGDTHQVVLSVKTNNRADRDTVYWNENNMPPIITLTSATNAMIGVNQPSAQALTISADIIDDGTVDNARLFYRRSTRVPGSYTEIPMTRVSGSLFQAIIPAARVLNPGIDFYILATDNYHLIGRSPNVLVPESQPYVIPVGNEVPVVVHSPPQCLVAAQSNSIQATITDRDGTFYAVLYYKKGNESFYTIDTMLRSSGNIYTGTIPQNMITADGIDYYIRAVDSLGASARFPHSGTISLILCNNNNAPIASAGPNQQLFLVGSGCSRTVLLDGSGSHDPDGDPLTYTWTGPFSGSASGVAPSVSLSSGRNEIILRVTDRGGLFGLDTVVITVSDTIAPVPNTALLPALNGQCAVTVSVSPTATDNCAGIINATTADPLTYNAEGTFVLNWIYNDRNGNTLTQVQQVIVKDAIPPQITAPHDTTIVISALRQFTVVKVDTIKALDNCSRVSMRAVRSDGLPLDTVFFIGTTVIKWFACDAKGNCDSAVQSIIIKLNHAPVLTVPSDFNMNEGELVTSTGSVSDSDVTVPRVSLINPPTFIQVTNTNGVITFVSRPGCTDHGLDTIRVQASDGIDSVVSQFQILVGDINFPPVFVPIALQKTKEQQPFSLAVRVNDCDGIIPKIRLVNTPLGASFVDNLDGHGTFTWTPKGDENGYYVVVFEATDGADPSSKARDTVVIQVEDVNCFPPTLSVSTSEVNTSVNLPITILATASDSGDGVPPLLITSVLPAGAHFTTDPDNGTGVFTWTPTSPGTSIFVIYAVDAFDTTMKVERNITINVTNNNLTGPVFNPCNDTTIEQNIEMVMKVSATDPDATIPQLYLINGPLGASVVDNKNGTAAVIWKPASDVSGHFAITVGASDQVFFDTLVINVIVRDVNCAPVLNYISDVSASPGEMIQIGVSAFDPDNDGSTPTLSAASDIPGFSFITSANATAVFRCQAPMSSGMYPVVFYASDGMLTDSMKVTISVGKSGSLKICVNQVGAQIFKMPSGSFRGNYLGHDTITFSAPQSAYWFEVQAAGYRAQRIACNIKADSVIVQSVTLKPSIPIMVCSPDTLTIGTAGANPESGSFSFVDLNKDQMEDLIIISLNGSVCYNGLDNINQRSYQLQLAGFRNITAGFDPIHHIFVDWDNNGVYDCLLSDKSGNIVVIGQNGAVETLVRNPGAKLYPIVMDADKDGKKDLIVNFEGHGLFLYLNSGTDSVPIITSGVECKNDSAQSFTDFKGVPVLLDLDNDGREELIILSGGVLKVFTINSTFAILTYKEDLNCAGKRIVADSLSMALIGSSLGTPKLAIRIKDKILIYPTHLLGDVNHDLVVNIQDISKISKQLEFLETNPGFTAANNLKLSDNGGETIDIRDITRASKSWELQE